MADEILNDIHKKEPLPNKINNNNKKTPKLAFLDSTIPIEQRKLAYAIYALMVLFAGDKTKDFYNKDIDGNEIKELSVPISPISYPTENLTDKDLEYIDFSKSIISTKNEYVFAFDVLKAFNVTVGFPKKVKDKDGNETDVDEKGTEETLTLDRDFGVIKNKQDQTEFMRSLNHVMREANGSEDLNYNYISTELPKELFVTLENQLRDVIKNIKNDPMNHDFDRGVLPSVANEIIRLCNKYLSNLGDTIKITEIPISNDETDQDVAKNLKSADKQLTGILGKIKNVFNTQPTKAKGDLLSSVAGGIVSVANAIVKESLSTYSTYSYLRESTDEQSSDKKEEEFQNVKEFFPDRPFATFNTYKEMSDSWKSPEQITRDKEDLDFATQVVKPFTDGKEFLNYLNSLRGNQKEVSKLLDVISRQIYIASDGKNDLSTLDEKANYALSDNWSEFEEYINSEEPNNRDADYKALTFFNTKKNGSGYDAAVAAYNKIQQNKEAGEAAAESFGDKDALNKNSSELDSVVNTTAKEMSDKLSELKDELRKKKYMDLAKLNLSVIIKNTGIDVQQSIIEQDTEKEIMSSINDDINNKEAEIETMIDDISSKINDSQKNEDLLKDFSNNVDSLNKSLDELKTSLIEKLEKEAGDKLHNIIKKYVKAIDTSSFEEQWLNSAKELISQHIDSMKSSIDNIYKSIDESIKNNKQESISFIAAEMKRIIG